jgi:hypothetical protein
VIASLHLSMLNLAVSRRKGSEVGRNSTYCCATRLIHDEEPCALTDPCLSAASLATLRRLDTFRRGASRSKSRSIARRISNVLPKRGARSANAAS